MSTMHGSGITIDYYANPIDVTPMRIPDMHWSYTDSAGHVHRWEGEDREWGDGATVPTVRWVVDVEGDDEYPERGHNECRQCGERINPAWRSPATRRWVPGLQEFLVNGTPVSKEDAETIAAALRAQHSADA